MTDLGNDFRLADFKLLLPLRRDARTLVIAAADTRFLPHLADELGEIQVVRSDSPLIQPEGLYELVFSESLNAARYLSPGGTLCHLSCHLAPANPDKHADQADGLKLIGRWRAFPSWPNFRVLIPDNAIGWKAAIRGLRLLPLRSWLGIVARILPAIAARTLPRHGITLYQRESASNAAPSSLLEGVHTVLKMAAGRSSGNHHFEPVNWIPVSGQLGPGNPILAFRMDDTGSLRELVKVARYPGADHLLLEANKLQLIEKTLGPVLAARVILPTASACVDGRHALAYDYVPTFAFAGLRWRLQARRGFCLAITDWLADVALTTRRNDDFVTAKPLHCDPLCQLIERNILPAGMQADAQRALHWLQVQDSLPTVFEHGDLGIYNMRMSSANGSDFMVLDWGSSTFEGIALGDLAYLLSSARASTELAAECLQRYLQRLQLDTDAAAPLWFAYLARRWAELDNVRTPVATDRRSGGGVLLAIHDQAWPSLMRVTT